MNAGISDQLDRRFLFLVASARPEGNSEQLARHAASSLPAGVEQRWLRLADLSVPAFVDARHRGDGAYELPSGDARTLLDATLAATDLVFVAPLYWYSVPASLKLYLDHWSGWMRVPDLEFKTRSAGKIAWAVSVYSDTDPALAEPLFATLRLSAEYMGMRWGGSLLGEGNRPGSVLDDRAALDRARLLFVPRPVLGVAAQ